MESVKLYAVNSMVLLKHYCSVEWPDLAALAQPMARVWGRTIPV